MNKGYLLSALLIMGAMSCQTAKMATETSVEKTDSTRSDSSLVVNNSDSAFSDLVQTDTAIGIPGTRITLTLDSAHADDDTTVVDGNVSLHLYTDNKGKRHAECKADSLTMVVKNLIRENTWLKQRRDSATVKQSNTTVRTDTRTVMTKRQKTGWWARWRSTLLYILIFLLGLVTGRILAGLLKIIG